MTRSLPEKVFRLTRDCYAHATEDALSGIGGLYDAGRWHSLGKRIVYTSSSTALCLLERLVHLDEWIAERHTDRVMLALSLPSISFIPFEASELAALDPNWRAVGNPTCQALGDAWLTGLKSCAMMVPSAANPPDFNILLNPLHPEFASIVDANRPLVMERLEPDERVVALARAGRPKPA